MNAQLSATTVMITLLAVLVAACGSTDGAVEGVDVPTTRTLAGPLSLEEYFDRVGQLDAEFDRDTQAVADRLQDVDPGDEEAALRSAQDLLPGLIPVMDGYVAGLREITPPPEAQGAHAEYLAALQQARQAFAKAFDTKLASASSFLDLLDVLLAPEIEAAVTGFDEACAQLTSVATSSDITVGLSCAFLEGEQDEPPAAETVEPTEVPTLESHGPELSADDYFRRLEEIVVAADLDEPQAQSPESDREAREQMMEIIDLSIAGYDGMREDLLELNPPGLLRPAHAQFVAAVQGQEDYFAGFDDLTADSSEQLWQIFAAGLVFGDAMGAYVEACLGLQNLAGQNGIQLDLNCPFN